MTESSNLPRHIVLLFDGTGDWIGSDRTNVAKLFTALDEDPELCYYDGGVGTLIDFSALSPIRRSVLHLLDQATATSLRDKVLQGYLFLVRHYRPGDQIYLFGFSRGAYTARLLASMVHLFGVLRPSAENIAPYLWQSFSTLSDIEVFKTNAQDLKGQFAVEESTSIQFMGVFDTVSSVGIVARFNVYPYTAKNPSIKRTCHAVSIEESRNAFPENLFSVQQPNLTEVWFPGVHRDAGGGVPPKASRIADEALRWIQLEAERCGLHFKEALSPDPTCDPAPNYPPSDPYVLFGPYPMRMFTKRLSAYRTVWPNFRHARRMPEGALVHTVAEAVFQAPGGRGNPTNYPKHWIPFSTGDEKLTAGSGLVAKIGPQFADLLGTVIGISFLALMWNGAVGSPYGRSWPGFNGAWVVLILVLFVVSQGIGKKTTNRLPPRIRPRAESALPWTAALLLLAVPFVYGLSPLLWGSVSLGILTWGFAQLGPWPILPTDRTLPFFLYATLASSILFRIITFLLPTLFGPTSTPFVFAVTASATFVPALATMFRDRPAMARGEAAKSQDIGMSLAPDPGRE